MHVGVPTYPPVPVPAPVPVHSTTYHHTLHTQYTYHTQCRFAQLLAHPVPLPTAVSAGAGAHPLNAKDSRLKAGIPLSLRDGGHVVGIYAQTMVTHPTPITQSLVPRPFHKVLGCIPLVLGVNRPSLTLDF